MPSTGQVRWGIAGTAGIARKAFLPALRAAGGTPAAVAGRDAGRTARYAAEHGVQRAVQGYEALIGDPGIDALYIALPNGLHAEWTTRALRAGKPVLCEKPLCATLAETEQVLAVARETGTLLWEAFVFPFHDQMSRVHDLLAEGAIGELREIQANFHFALARPEDIRLRRGLAGGALNDVGCYPVRLAVELMDTGLRSSWATARWGGDGVDVDLQGSLGYRTGQRLMMSCGFERSDDRFARLLGTAGQIHLTDPYHPGPDDTFTVFQAGKDAVSYPAAGPEPSFTPAIRHIEAVLRGEEQPRSLAVDNSLPAARGLQALREAAGDPGGGGRHDRAVRRRAGRGRWRQPRRARAAAGPRRAVTRPGGGDPRGPGRRAGGDAGPDHRAAPRVRRDRGLHRAGGHRRRARPGGRHHRLRARPAGRPAGSGPGSPGRPGRGPGPAARGPLRDVRELRPPDRGGPPGRPPRRPHLHRLRVPAALARGAAWGVPQPVRFVTLTLLTAECG